MSILKQLFRSKTTILDRYLIREFTGPFILAILGFAVIGIVDILFYLVELAVISGVPFIVTIRLLLYKLPAIMILFFPMSVLFSIMLLLVRFAKDNELTVLRASGISTIRILFPLLLCLIITSLLSYYINESIVPWTNKTSENLIRKEIQRKAPPEINENIIFKDHENRFFYIKKVNSKLAEMDNILMIDPSGNFPKIITAAKGVWDQNSWTLIDGHIQEMNNDGVIDFTNHFSEMTLHIDEDLAAHYSRRKTTKEMDSKELKSKILALNKGGISTRALRVEYHMKKSIPAACFIFGLIGIGFCINFVRSGKDWWGVIIAICISVLTVGFYFFLVALSRAFAKDGTIPALLGAWVPNIFYGLIATMAISYHCIRK